MATDNQRRAIMKMMVDEHRSIPYRPKIAQATRSVTAAILLQQIAFRWEKNESEAFYKFMAPCSHELYREGDSWQEELGFSRRELEGAFSIIATKITKGISRKEMQEITNLEIDDQGTITNLPQLILYWTDKHRVTHFWLNEQLYVSFLAHVYGFSDLVSPESGNTIKCTDPPFLYNVQNEHYIEMDDPYITFPYIDDHAEMNNREYCANAQIALDAQTEPQQPALEILDLPEETTNQPNSTVRKEKESSPRRAKKCSGDEKAEKAPSTRLMDAVREATTAQGITLNTGGQKVVKQVADEVLPMESTPEEVKAAIALALSRNNVGVYPLRRLPQDLETYRNRERHQPQHGRQPNQSHEEYMANTYDPHFAAYLEKVMAQQQQQQQEVS